MPYEFYLGIDTPSDDAPSPEGKGLVVWTLLEKETPDVGAHDGEEPRYHVRLVQHGGADLEPEALADRVQTYLTQDPYPGRTGIVVNRASKRGQAFYDAFAETGLSPIGVTVTTGKSAIEGEDGIVVSERQLVARLDGLYHDGRLELPQENSEKASQIAQGLQSFRRAVGEEGSEGFVEDETSTPRAGEHDVHLLSAALAAFVGEERSFHPTEHLSGDAPTTGRAKRMARPDVTS